MKYTKKERMNIGRQIYEDQINKYEAAGKYGISAQTAREYMRMYRNTNHLPPKTSKPRDYGLAKAKVIPEAAKLDEYQKMSKEDLISALIDARIREERLKLGYEVVEEDDSKKKAHYLRQKDCEVIVALSGSFPVELLCERLGIPRSRGTRTKSWTN